MKIRCRLDGLLLEARMGPGGRLQVFDGGESFQLEALEALLYELVCATPEEVIRLEQAHYRLLDRAEDFNHKP